jgi:hypothetical protein
VKSVRLLDWKNLAVSFQPLHLVVGASFHTVTVPTPVRDSSGRRIPGRRIRFIHLHVPFFFITLSWQIPA